MTMISRMIRPAVPSAATNAMKEMFLTLSSELTAVSRLRWPWVTSALSGAERGLQRGLGGVDVFHAVDGDDHGGQFAGQFRQRLGRRQGDVEGVVAERGAGVEQAGHGEGLVLLMVNVEPDREAVLLGEGGAQQRLGGVSGVVAEAGALRQLEGLAGAVHLGADAGGGDGKAADRLRGSGCTGGSVRWPGCGRRAFRHRRRR